jgi:hypothetical protein
MQLSLSCQPKNSTHFTEPKVSLPRSQQPTTVPYPKPDKSSPHHHPTSLRSILSSCHLRLRFPIGLFPSCFHTKIVYALLFHACYIRSPSHTPWLHHSNNICRGVQARKRQQEERNKHGGLLYLFSAIRSSETSVKFYRTERHHVPGSDNIYSVIFLQLSQVS